MSFDLRVWRAALLSSALSVGRASANGALDALLPPRCLSCGEMVAATGGLCASCWTTVTMVGAPFCRRCGLPFPYDVPGPAICGDCARSEPPWREARSAVVYDDGGRPCPVCRTPVERVMKVYF